MLTCLAGREFEHMLSMLTGFGVPVLSVTAVPDKSDKTQVTIPAL